MFLRPLFLGLLTLTLLGSGCRKSEVASYTVPKETSSDPHGPAPHAHDAAGNPVFAAAAPPASTAAAPAPAPAPSPAQAPAPAAGGMTGTAVPTASGQSLTWTAPAQWVSKPASAMRKATYMIPGSGGEAELAISTFGGEVGGELANVNRWRGQAGIELPPISEADLATAVTRREHNGLKFGIVDFAGSTPAKQRVIGAWVPFAGGTWFFKLNGSAAQLEKDKATFLAFLESVKPAAARP